MFKRHWLCGKWLSGQVFGLYIKCCFRKLGYLIGQKNVGQNFSFEKIFVTHEKFSHFCPTKILSNVEISNSSFLFFTFFHKTD